MVLYTVTGKVGEKGYLDIAKSGDLTGKNIYVNMTNKCPCSCVFCLRQTKKQQENNTLWLKDGEPSIEEVLELFTDNLCNCRILDRKSTRLNSSHRLESRMPSSA